ncbi:hypothetical protein L910_2109 [Vibrio fluvialis PG41]|uniref:Uncharacterized protein n=1 Tax=Vibrio fluvialis PG41 TaxID=1336752 RepID=S7I941_VIBFL|nr:hypothetical protein L910_2109 [Vibrio fluvialis PG41]
MKARPGLNHGRDEVIWRMKKPPGWVVSRQAERNTSKVIGCLG